jgi:hypothetical protein
MTFERLQGGFRVKINKNLVGINPKSKFSANFYIFTKRDNLEKFKEEKIFYLPGEYEVNDIFIFGFSENESVNFLLKGDENLLVLEEKFNSIPEILDLILQEPVYVFLLNQDKSFKDILKDLNIKELILQNNLQANFFEKELACKVSII